MITNDYKVTIDFEHSTYIEQKSFVQGDSLANKIIFTFNKDREGVDLAGTIVGLVFKRSDGVQIIAEATIIDAEAGEAEYTLANNILDVAGQVLVSVALFGLENERLTYPVQFPLTVIADLGFDDESIEEDDRYPILTELLSDVATIAFDEGIRQNNESTRELNEGIRESNETLRQASITDIESRFEALTTQEQQDAEVINARMSTNKGKTFASLGARIEEVEEDVKDKTIIIPGPVITPGNNFLLGGNLDAGFAGFVPASDFINGTTLASEIGLSSGTAQHSDVPWIKYIYKGKVCFTPLKTYRRSVTWGALYNAGAVYASGDEGTLPPMGRIGTDLIINASDNSINTVNQKFLGDKSEGMDYADTVAGVGDVIVLKGFANAANNGEFTVSTITNTKIVLTGGTLVDETGGKKSKIYKKTNAVTQNRTVVIDGLTYKVRLMSGGANDPLDSSADADRDGIGVDDEWNAIMLPIHVKAKTQGWDYPAYVGTTEYWESDLTDEDLLTSHLYGAGSFSWCKNVNNLTSWRRVLRGLYGVSYLYWPHSWVVDSHNAWRPVLELLG